MEEVVIVGAGIAGLATAVALKRIGVKALVLEKATSLRTEGATLTLFPNAWHALDALSVSHKLTPLYSPCYKGKITNIDAGEVEELSFTSTNRSKGGALRVVHRKALLRVLADELPDDTIRFSSKLSSIQTQPQHHSSIPIIHLSDGISIKAKVVIGCDGVNSMVARRLGMGEPINSGRWAIRGLSIFPKGHCLTNEFLQYVSVGKIAGFVPLNDEEVYWFLFLSHIFVSQGKGKEMAGNPKLIQREVIENFAKEMPGLYSNIVQNSDLSTLTCAPLLYRSPWNVFFGNICVGNITLAGDAMHPMTPDLGQNECAALEDAVVFAKHVAHSVINDKMLDPREASRALSKYAEQTKWRAARLITISYLSGWVQQDACGWVKKFGVGKVFHRVVSSCILDIIQYDCGKLPACVFEEESNMID